MSDEKITFDGVVEDISSGADAGLKVTKGFFPKTLGLFDETLYNWLKPKLTPKQSETVEAHLLQATEKKDLILSVDHTEISSATALIEWVDSVKDLDPGKYPNASERWHEALRKVLSGSREMLLAMQKVKPDTIERFAETGTITLDDAIEFEKLGLGAVQNPQRTMTHDATNRGILLLIGKLVGAMLFAIVPATLLASYLVDRFSLHEALVLLGLLPGLFWGFREIQKAHDVNHPPSWFAKTTTHVSMKFLQSHLGSYVLTTALGQNPNRTVLWDIYPEEVQRAQEHIAQTPGLRRDLHK